MKSIFKKLACLTLAVLMLLSVTACSKKGNDADTSDLTLGWEVVEEGQGGSGSGSGSDKLIDQSSKGAKVVNNCYVTGYPVAKKKVKLSVMMYEQSGISNPNKTALAQFIEQKFNVDLEIQTIPNEQVKEKVTLAFASGTTPDLFWGMGIMGDVSKIASYVKADKIYSYDDYKDFAPNLYKMFSENKEAQYLCTSEDGKIYTAPLYRTDTDNYTDLFYINKTWLKKLGLSMPKTLEDLTNVLRKFRDNDPNGNGKADEIPMMFVDEMPVSWYGFFGMSTYDMTTRTKDNQIKIAYTTDEYKKAISTLADFYSEGLLYNKDMRTMSASKAKSLMDASVKTVGVVAGVFNGNYSGLMSAETYVNHYSLMPLVDATGKGEQVAAYMDKEACWPLWGFIPKTCEYPEIAVRLMDYFYSTEGSAVATYGPYGKNTFWNYNSEGKPVLNNNGKSSSSFWLGHGVPRFISNEINQNKFFVNEKEYADKATATAIALYNAEFDAIYGNLKPRKTYNAPRTADETKKLSDQVSSKLTDTRVSWTYEFIYGTKNINSEWSTYINTINNLGAAVSQEVYQAADTRMQNWLKNNK